MPVRIPPECWTNLNREEEWSLIQGKTSRRGFIWTSSSAAAAITFLPKSVWGANERVNVACIGIGGKGFTDVTGASGAGGTIAALCDVDDNRRNKGNQKIEEMFPKAKFYRDFRELLEKEEKLIDAVIVSTPDHTHCHASVMAMRTGKHVYTQKPLTHSISEARLIMETAKKYGVATQMGNGGHAREPIRRGVELIRAGLIGKVYEVHCWTNRPTWPQGGEALMGNARVQWALGNEGKRPPTIKPDGIDWDLWLGPAPFRPYDSCYAPFNWRGWWDFGTGALGDMGCHIMDMPYWALELKYPTGVEADQKGNTLQTGPVESTVTYRFPAGKYSTALEFKWYDGGRMPSPDVIGDFGLDNATIAKRFDLVMIGERGKFFFNRGSEEWATSPEALLKDFEEPVRILPRATDEYAEWIKACKGGSPALSNFDHSGPFTEMVLLGNLAIRLGKKIEWDGPNMKANNAPEADPLIKREYREGWEL